MLASTINYCSPSFLQIDLFNQKKKKAFRKQYTSNLRRSCTYKQPVICSLPFPLSFHLCDCSVSNLNDKLWGSQQSLPCRFCTLQFILPWVILLVLFFPLCLISFCYFTCCQFSLPSFSYFFSLSHLQAPNSLLTPVIYISMGEIESEIKHNRKSS